MSFSLWPWLAMASFGTQIWSRSLARTGWNAVIAIHGRFRAQVALLRSPILRTARLWDAATGKALATLAGRGGWVYSAQFSPDGSRIVTASDDRTARVWR